jgi:hypothetical protein
MQERATTMEQGGQSYRAPQRTTDLSRAELVQWIAEEPHHGSVGKGTVWAPNLSSIEHVREGLSCENVQRLRIVSIFSDHTGLSSH